MPPLSRHPLRWTTLLPAALSLLAVTSCTPPQRATVAVVAQATEQPVEPPTVAAPDASPIAPATATVPAAPATTSAQAGADACADPTIQSLGTGWNFVIATAPLAGEQVQSGFHLRGCGDVFEASFGWRLRDDGGSILVEDFAMMSCGTGCVGTFDLTVAYPPVAEPLLASLEVYTTSMNDGAELLRSVIPIVLH